MWGILWRSDNKLDGKTRRLQIGDGHKWPLVFRTKKAAQQHIKERYGYIAKCRDLRIEPHGWRIPIPVRISIVHAEAG